MIKKLQKLTENIELNPNNMDRMGKANFLLLVSALVFFASIVLPLVAMPDCKECCTTTPDNRTICGNCEDLFTLKTPQEITADQLKEVGLEKTCPPCHCEVKTCPPCPKPQCTCQQPDCPPCQPAEECPPCNKQYDEVTEAKIHEIINTRPTAESAAYQGGWYDQRKIWLQAIGHNTSHFREAPGTNWYQHLYGHHEEDTFCFNKHTPSSFKVNKTIWHTIETKDNIRIIKGENNDTG